MHALPNLELNLRAGKQDFRDQRCGPLLSGLWGLGTLTVESITFKEARWTFKVFSKLFAA